MTRNLLNRHGSSKQRSAKTHPLEALEEYLSVTQLALRIPYSPKTIRNLIWRGVFQEGVHYTRLTGRPIFIWSRVEELLRRGSNGRAC